MPPQRSVHDDSPLTNDGDALRGGCGMQNLDAHADRSKVCRRSLAASFAANERKKAGVAC
jgi:hypothetical protein